MLDKLIIGYKDSFDFDASVAESSTNPPAKKSIKETVPFSNIIHDFSAINGETYWEERELEYTLEIVADSPAELERKKRAFSAWVMNVQNQNIYDPFIEDYHFILCTYKDMDYSDEEHKEKTTATVTFTAYPYMVANKPKIYNVSLDGTAEKTVLMMNESAHRITPTINTSVPVTLNLGNASYSVSAGETTDEILELEVGANTMTIQSTEAGNITISFYEEVF